MKKRNVHGAIWSEMDEQQQVIGLVQADSLEEAAKQAEHFHEYGVDVVVYDKEELEEAFQEGDTVVVIKNGVVQKREDTK